MWIDVGEVKVELVEPDCGVCRHQAKGAFEPETRAAFAEYAIPGSTVLDIGAYTGLYAIAAAKMGCLVHAFEPMPAAMGRLALNMVLNNVDFFAHDLAVSDEDGASRMRFNPLVALTSGASLVGSRAGQHKVKTVKLDSMDFGHISLMKIDVERAELLVLAGAAETIRLNRPVIIAEALESDFAGEMLAVLPDYRLERMLDGVNCLFLPN
jgi:FkbM family methyltransferase